MASQRSEDCEEWDSKNNNCTTITESGCLSTGGYVSSSEDENVDMDWKISCLDNFNISLLPS